MDVSDQPCPLCGRPMVKGSSIDRHHWVPKKFKGLEWSWMHRICHKKIHSLFSEKQLAEAFNSPEKLLQNEDIVTFVRWVRKQPPEKLGRHRPPKK